MITEIIFIHDGILSLPKEILKTETIISFTEPEEKSPLHSHIKLLNTSYWTESDFQV